MTSLPRLNQAKLAIGMKPAGGGMSEANLGMKRQALIRKALYMPSIATKQLMTSPARHPS